MGQSCKAKRHPEKKILLADLIAMDDNDAVCREVKHIVSLIYRDATSDTFIEVFNTVLDAVVSLFKGTFEGYRSCNTQYHDLKHTTDILLASARLIHGAHLKRLKLSEKTVMLGLVSALMHDTGYIQTENDMTGTGAKYTLRHVERSVEFMRGYFTRKGYPKEYIESCSAIIGCTGINTRIENIKFPSAEITAVGQIIGTADLVGQMADRVYLEKLLFLFYEFQEGMPREFESELDILKRTLGFYAYSKQRLKEELGGMGRYFRWHFKECWNLDCDLYDAAVKNNISYLKLLIDKHQQDYRSYLKRGGIVKMLDKAL